MRRFRFFSSFFFLFLFVSCANRVIPTGGEREIMPPLLLNASPPLFTTNFVGDRIELRFDEYVQLVDQQKQIVFSPPIIPPPKVEIRKKSVWVTFRDTLSSQTTYNIQFGNAIADIHENTPVAGFRYVFSTGNTIDSAFVSGQVSDALTGLPVKETIVALYGFQVPDSMIYKTPPDYFSRADSSGKFLISNVKPGRYTVTAIQDQNNNHVADQPGEKVAFINEIQELNDSLNFKLSLSSALPVPLTIKSSWWESPGKLITVFSGPAHDASPVFVDTSNVETKVYRNVMSDSVIIWTMHGIKDPVNLLWTVNGTILDTVSYLRQRGAKDITDKKPAYLTGEVYPFGNGKLSAERFPSVLWHAPLVRIDTSGIRMMRDSINIPFTTKVNDSLRTITSFEFEHIAGEYRIVIQPGTATDIYQRSNDTMNVAFFIPAERTAGSISLNLIVAGSTQSIVQLVNEKNEVIAERMVTGDLKTIFQGLDPGNYLLRLVHDQNGNKRWDPGDFLKRIQPEQVIYYQEKITVRSNWEVELDWHE